MANVHGSAIVLGHHGLLLRGPSGAGKSLLAQECLSHAEQVGLHAAWVGDDRVELAASAGALIASPAPTIAGKAELRFLGIHTHLHVAAARIDLVGDILPVEDLQRLPAEQNTAQIEGITLPSLALPVSDRGHAMTMIFQQLLLWSHRIAP